ncbi:TPA: hypothetical protein ACQDQW_002493, partial [Legionella pneumophila]
ELIHPIEKKKSFNFEKNCELKANSKTPMIDNRIKHIKYKFSFYICISPKHSPVWYKLIDLKD